MFEVPEGDEDHEKLNRVLDVLRGMGVQKIVYDLNGYGDDGECTLESITMTDGSTGDDLPDFTISFLSDGTKESLLEFLIECAIELPSENWCDNDGGSGQITFRPFEDEASERIEVDMTYHDEENGCDNDLEDVDFDDEDDLDEDEDGPADDSDGVEPLDVVISTDLSRRHAA